MVQFCRTTSLRALTGPRSRITRVAGPDVGRVTASFASTLAASLLALVAFSVPAASQSLGYVLTPAAERIQWDKDLAFKDDWLYGGRVGLLFGQQVELQPFYFFANNYPIDAGGAAASFGPAAVGRSIDIRHFGANLQLNLGRGDVVPFIRGGGGLLQLRPDSGAKRERVAVSAGGGIRFSIGGLNAELYAEQMAMRLNPLNVFGVDSTSNGVAPTQRNIVYGAAFSLPLSTMSDAIDSDAGLKGTTAPIEPFVGQLRYASKLGLEDQDLAGVRAGIDFSPQVGLRAFYWRGVNDDRDGTAPVAGYGGEAQLNLNSGTGISPYLILGAGRIDYLKDFRDPAGNTREDQGVLIAGGGASLRLTDRLRLNASVRDYVMTPEEKLTDVSTTDDLTHNTLISAGLTISIGGSSGMSSREAEMRRQRESLDRTERQLAIQRERLAAQRERQDSAGLERDARQRGGEAQRAGRDQSDAQRRMMRERGDSTMTRMRGDSMVQRGKDASRWITVPVPEVGEVILRYGLTPSGSTSTTTTSTQGLSSDELRRLIREELQRDSMDRGAMRTTTDTASSTSGLSPRSASEVARLARIAAMEDELQRRLDAMQRLEVERRSAISAPSAQPTRTVVLDSSGDARIASVPVFQRFGETRSRDLRPFLGVGGGDGTQAVASLRADLGPLTPGSGFRFAPELALGFGGGSTSVLALANVQYPFGSIGGNASVRPYVTLGAGVFSPSVLAVNTAVGASFLVGSQRASPLYTFVELQGLNLFNYTRLMVGVSSRR